VFLALPKTYACKPMFWWLSHFGSLNPSLWVKGTIENTGKGGRRESMRGAGVRPLDPCP
jgi:hypothetical protein